jgi:RNA polymerase sigma-70 factor, ECF subfamily
VAVDETGSQAVTSDELRPLMLSIAYRMVGSFSEAEDLVQEAFLRLHLEGDVENPRAWLTTVTTRLAIDHLRSARVRREQYPGTWLPEPVLADPAPEAAIRAETLSLAVLVLLERLSPLERAVFVLREAFDYGYDEIAAIVGKSEANCRQLVTRARRHVDERKPRFEADRKAREELAERFFAAAGEGDVEGLERLLAADVVMYGDGGGKAPAAGRPLHGRRQVGKVLLGLTKQAVAFELEMRRVERNGQPGAMFITPEGELLSVVALDVADGQITAVRSIVNPEKLGHLGLPVADARALLRSVSERRKARG